MNIWFMADPHFGHENLVLGVTKWEGRTEQCRKFKTLEEHDATLVNNINDVVGQDDILYCIGDWAMGGKENVYNFRKRLVCSNIHLVLGNHDMHIAKNTIIQTDEGYKNIQSLFTSVTQILEKKIGGIKMILCHYPFRTWHGSGRGSYMLYGHVHGGLVKEDEKNQFKTMDVGIDTHPEFRPYHLEEVKGLLENKNNLNHH